MDKIKAVTHNDQRQLVRQLGFLQRSNVLKNMSEQISGKGTDYFMVEGTLCPRPFLTLRKFFTRSGS